MNATLVFCIHFITETVLAKTTNVKLRQLSVPLSGFHLKQWTSELLADINNFSMLFS